MPISSPEILSRSKKIASVAQEGLPDNSLFYFSGYIDKVGEMGEFYYIVLPEKKEYIQDDFVPNINLNLLAVDVNLAEVYVDEGITNNKAVAATNTVKPRTTTTNRTSRPKNVSTTNTTQPVDNTTPEDTAEADDDDTTQPNVDTVVEEEKRITTSGLEVSKSAANEVRLTWKASVKNATFVVYRTEKQAITSERLMNYSEKIAEFDSVGKKDRDLYRFPAFVDIISKSGKYYYIVLPKYTGYRSEDFSPNVNLNLKAAVVEISKVYVKDLYVKRAQDGFLIFWNLSYLSGEKKVFEVYRLTSLITDIKQLKNVKPIATLENELYYEDNSILFNKNYYYAVVLKTGPIINPGDNSTIEPVVYAKKDIPVRIERVVIRTNISLSDIQSRMSGEVVDDPQIEAAMDVRKESYYEKEVSVEKDGKPKTETPVEAEASGEKETEEPDTIVGEVGIGKE